ncbi:MAG: glutathionylspermidine synthase family protein [Oscillospiraceae bacterium]|nr:glutathionylspermidine synthase family protein [Oscillospiraceae bacterium]
MQKAEEYYKQLVDSNFEESVSSAKIQQQYIKTYTARYHGYYVHTLYIPKMFTEEMAEYFNEISSVMYGILEKVIREYQSNAEYRKLFGFEERLERLILRLNHYECALPIARIDIFFNEDDFSFKFCEFNADGSSAMNEDKELNQAIKLTSTYNEFIKKYNVRTFELFDSWVKAFKDIYKTYDRAVQNPYVAIADFFNGDISREFKAFKKAFEDSGIECEICEITDLKYENGKLLSPSGRHINAVYRRAVTCDIMRNYDRVLPFIRAAENNDVCLIGDFKTQVIHNKIVFKILHNDMTTAFLTDKEAQFVKEHIPYTVSLTDEQVKAHNVLSDKDKWVIKPEDSYASKGVYAGVEGMTDEEWKKEVTENIDNNYLLQEYCEPYATVNIDITHDENAKYKKYSNITGIYLYGGKMAGLYSRIAKNSIISTQYSEMSLPTVIVSEKRENPH